MIELQNKMPLEQQEALLKKCMDESLSLDDELDACGMSYEQLRYRNYPLLPDISHSLHRLDDHEIIEHGVPVISFFAGAGGLDIGFRHAGFRHLAAIEINQDFCETLRTNNKDLSVIGPPFHAGDVRNRDELFSILRNSIGITTPFEGVFFGGPPCQPFSIAANQRYSKSGENFKRVGFSDEQRGNLLFDFIWFINEFKPAAFLIENVPGLLELDHGQQAAEAINLLCNDGYHVANPTILDAANYGVPQSRRRLFVVGTRLNKQFEFPYRDSDPIPCISIFETPLQNVRNHITRKHKAESVIRYMELDYGKRDALGRVDRLNPRLPSKTVIAGGTKGGGRSHLHPFIPRTLSVRESARLQTFPDSYVFEGAPARQFTQVGNAVPPILGFKLANAIYRQLFKQ